MLEALGLEGVRDLILWSENATKAEIAALTPVVARLARESDAVTGEILVKAVEELEGHVLTRHAVRRLDRDPDPLEGAAGLARAMLESG
ncbi:MAG: hypothetical protein ACOCUZ_02085 [bacterium]